MRQSRTFSVYNADKYKNDINYISKNKYMSVEETFCSD